MTTALLEALGRELPADRIVTDPDVLQALSSDEAEWAPFGPAAVAVRARTEAEVATVVRIAADLATPIVPRGAGTGLSGGANAVDGCVILDLSKMTAIREIDVENLTCVVEPGVVNDDLKAAAPNTACGIRRTRPARRGRPSAGTPPPTPAACAA